MEYSMNLSSLHCNLEAIPTPIALLVTKNQLVFSVVEGALLVIMFNFILFTLYLDNDPSYSFLSPLPVPPRPTFEGTDFRDVIIYFIPFTPWAALVFLVLFIGFVIVLSRQLPPRYVRERLFLAIARISLIFLLLEGCWLFFLWV